VRWPPLTSDTAAETRIGYLLKISRNIDVLTCSDRWSNAVFHKLSSAKGCQGFREIKTRIGGPTFVLYVRITFLVAMFDAKRSVTDSMQSLAAAFQKLPDSAVKSVSSADHKQNHVRRNDQVINQFEVSRGFCTRNVHNLHKCWCLISYLIYCGQAGVPH
jgi:hypothetical protein